MLKNKKRILAVLLSLLLVMAAVVPAFAENSHMGTVAAPLRFGTNGTLKIMHITDTHLSGDNVDDSVALIGLACDREQPDVIMLTGDIAMGDTRLECIDKLMTVFEKRNIPVAVTFGNHDSESGEYTREQVMEMYNAYSCSISLDDGSALSGCGTYYIPVLASDSDEIKFNLWVFDSGDYDSEGHYANVLEDQVEWYREQSVKLENEAGKKVPSLAFQHIIVPEIYEALSSSKLPGAYKYKHMYPDGNYYYFNSNAQNAGLLHETPCCGYYNHGQFDAMVERGDVLGMFFGHDHTNCFEVKYKGIRITNSLSTRYNGDAFSTQYGYRMITVNENDPCNYQTVVQHWFDAFTLEDIQAAKQAGNNETASMLSGLIFQGAFQKFFQRFAFMIVKIFAFRTVLYE